MTDDFFARHDAHSQGVYLVISYPAAIGKDEKYAILSSKKEVDKYTDELGTDYINVISPYIIDEPNFGNIPKEKLQ